MSTLWLAGSLLGMWIVTAVLMIGGTGDDTTITERSVVDIPNRSTSERMVPTPTATERTIQPSSYRGGDHVHQLRSLWSSDGHYDSLIRAYPWPAAEAEAIMMCESKGDPSVISPTNDYGLMGINKVHAYRVGGDVNQLLIPEVNIRVAHEIYTEAGGWNDWRYSRGCHGVY